jgi:hypothetical protein
LPAKNTLTTANARLLEEAFVSKMGSHSDLGQEEVQANARADTVSMPAATERKRAGRRKPRPRSSTATGIDKSVLTFPEPRRLRDKDHLKFVSAQPCLICGRQPSDAHHIRFAQLRALGRKVSDEFTVPLCRTHHREIHGRGDEAAWWSQYRLDPLTVASNLRRQTHTLSPEPLSARDLMKQGLTWAIAQTAKTQANTPELLSLTDSGHFDNGWSLRQSQRILRHVFGLPKNNCPAVRQ